MERGKYFQSNRKTRVFMDAVAELTGRRGLRVLLNLTELYDWMDELPPYDDELAIDFVDVAALSEKLYFMYGPNAARRLGVRAGRMMFRAVQAHFGTALGLDEAILQTQEAPQRLSTLLHALAASWSLHSDSEVTVELVDGRYLMHIEPCPECWGCDGIEDAICSCTVGFLQDAIEWAALGDFYHVVQVACSANANCDGCCTFESLPLR